MEKLVHSWQQLVGSMENDPGLYRYNTESEEFIGFLRILWLERKKESKAAKSGTMMKYSRLLFLYCFFENMNSLVCILSVIG